MSSSSDQSQGESGADGGKQTPIKPSSDSTTTDKATSDKVGPKDALSKPLEPIGLKAEDIYIGDSVVFGTSDDEADKTHVGEEELLEPIRWSPPRHLQPSATVVSPVTCPGSKCQCGQVSCVRNTYCSLQNLGFTCYANSVLQLIYNAEQLRTYFLSPDQAQKGHFHWAIAELFQNMATKALEHINNSKYPNFSPKAFHKAFCAAQPSFRLNEQHDAQEYVTVLLEMLHQEVNKAKKADSMVPFVESKSAQQAWDYHAKHVDDSALSQMLMGQTETALTCTTCGNCSLSWSPFWQLQLDLPEADKKQSTTLFGEALVPSIWTLTDCIKEFTAEETLKEEAAPHCVKCGQRRSSTKKQSICRVPPLLLVHLKRISASGSKIARPVDIDDQIELAGKRYQLLGCIIHRGSNIESGHYIAFIRQSHLHFGMFDDQEIVDQLHQQVAHESELRRFAYLCMYKQMYD